MQAQSTPRRPHPPTHPAAGPAWSHPHSAPRRQRLGLRDLGKTHAIARQQLTRPRGVGLDQHPDQRIPSRRLSVGPGRMGWPSGGSWIAPGSTPSEGRLSACGNAPPPARRSPWRFEVGLTVKRASSSHPNARGAAPHAALAGSATGRHRHTPADGPSASPGPQHDPGRPPTCRRRSNRPSPAAGQIRRPDTRCASRAPLGASTPPARARYARAQPPARPPKLSRAPGRARVARHRSIRSPFRRASRSAPHTAKRVTASATNSAPPPSSSSAAALGSCRPAGWPPVERRRPSPRPAAHPGPHTPRPRSSTWRPRRKTTRGACMSLDWTGRRRGAGPAGSKSLAVVRPIRCQPPGRRAG